jgi:hypothetical protein
MTDARSWHVGNASADSEEWRGWFVGHFVDPDDVRMSKEVEIKWGTHPAGEEREAWQTDEYRTTVLLLIRGRFQINLSVGNYVLAEEGDYAMWSAGIGHSWKAEEDSVVVTVRWPSMEDAPGPRANTS